MAGNIMICKKVSCALAKRKHRHVVREADDVGNRKWSRFIGPRPPVGDTFPHDPRRKLNRAKVTLPNVSIQHD